MNLRRQIFIIAVALAPLAMPSSARSDVKVCPIEETIMLIRLTPNETRYGLVK